ncbi:uncharacterized protein LOC114435424 isoform X1 [Parambassis ranga]|uniref:Uncharacterized protein LOC114435424 isoform X1 n=1 Tax=Parambassis ranga TaxID=210632 RepID=A0A6P7I894_9TELE|nr:uncharacterized protein LOC114435424 isoform X1 [Parambassis ranga]
MSQPGQEDEQTQRLEVKDEDLAEAKDKLGTSGAVKGKTFQRKWVKQLRLCSVEQSQEERLFSTHVQLDQQRSKLPDCDWLAPVFFPPPWKMSLKACFNNSCC